MSLDAFAEQLASPAATPGGGAAAARVGLYACSLLRMVIGINLKKWKEASAGPGKSKRKVTWDPASLSAVLEAAEVLSGRFESLEGEDMAAFGAYLEASRLPRSTPQEKEKRRLARFRAALQATEVPLNMMEAAREVLRLTRSALEIVGAASISAETDLCAAVELAQAAASVSELNARANMPQLAPEKLEDIGKRLEELKRSMEALFGELKAALMEKLGFAKTPEAGPAS